MLEGCGFEVKNIGIDVPSDKFVEAVKDYNADILCMSALLTTTMTYMKDVIQALEDAGIRQNVKVMVGGAPVTQNFADEIGADGYSDNANSAVAVAKELWKPVRQAAVSVFQEPPSWHVLPSAAVARRLYRPESVVPPHSWRVSSDRL